MPRCVIVGRCKIVAATHTFVLIVIMLASNSTSVAVQVVM